MVHATSAEVRCRAVDKALVESCLLDAEALYLNDGATLDNLREAVSTLEDTERTARRVLGGANPITKRIERSLRDARAELRARETPPPQE